MGYGHIKNNQGWHIRPDYGKYFQRMLLNLWQEPGIRTVAPPRTLAFFMKDYFERLNEYLDLIQYREYGLFKGEQGILFYQGSYFCLRLNSDYQISPVSWQEPARCLVSQAFLIEHLMEGYYQRQGKQYPYFSLKRIPGVLSKSIALFAERIFQ
ncbi:MAG: hypothetical protein HC880_16000 [Bacteroidia bacterium]|nr:hypothetical protein [Bacteroidia bacterium]